MLSFGILGGGSPYCYTLPLFFFGGGGKRSDRFTINGKGKEEKMDFSVLGKTIVSNFNSFYSLWDFARKGNVRVRPELPWLHVFYCPSNLFD